MIATVGRMLEAARAGWVAGRAAMEGRQPVLVDDVLTAEGCVCRTPRVVIIHDADTACGDGQEKLLEASITTDGPEYLQVLDLLAEEADRRDGVRRGPR